MFFVFFFKACDQIIDVNGQKFSRISHEDASLILKSSLINYRANSLPIKIGVRYLGKLPVLKSSHHQHHQSTKIDSCIRLVSSSSKLEILKSPDLFASIRHALPSPNDFLLFKYYLSEYLLSKINIQYFIHLLVNRVKISKKVRNKIIINILNFIYSIFTQFFR